MKIKDPSLNQIIQNNKKLIKRDDFNVLLLDMGKMYFIGDCCFRFNKIKYIENVIGNCNLTLCYSNPSNKWLYQAILKNHPFISKIKNKQWDEIDFESYDIIVIISNDEESFWDYFRNRYRHLFKLDTFKIMIFSISKLTLKESDVEHTVFPTIPGLENGMDDLGPGELYIDKNEVGFANKWLKLQGLKPDEKLFIIVDSASERRKLLKINVYFEILSQLLSRPKIKLLVFDERNIGKDQFYRAWLGDELVSRIIFSKGFSLRANLALISSDNIALIFGPCTGIMHCASSIYNNFTANNSTSYKPPLMVVYTGKPGKGNKNSDYWWGTSPLIDCLLLRKQGMKKQIISLDKIAKKDRSDIVKLSCTEYSSKQILEYLDSKLGLVF